MPDIVAWIHQGRYDNEQDLLNLKKNAEKRGRTDVLDAVHQRLKKVAPSVYQRLVGPLQKRNRDKAFNCYCNCPASLSDICNDIMQSKVPYDALTCDACWQEDLAATWGYYGWSSKIIPQDVWEDLCLQRSNAKFVEKS
jgi:hypothetical protein